MSCVKFFRAAITISWLQVKSAGIEVPRCFQEADRPRLRREVPFAFSDRLDEDVAALAKVVTCDGQGRHQADRRAEAAARHDPRTTLLALLQNPPHDLGTQWLASLLVAHQLDPDEKAAPAHFIDDRTALACIDEVLLDVLADDGASL